MSCAVLELFCAVLCSWCAGAGACTGSCAGACTGGGLISIISRYLGSPECGYGLVKYNSLNPKSNKILNKFLYFSITPLILSILYF